jgi:endonuclease YncB( thermonuclease family)
MSHAHYGNTVVSTVVRVADGDTIVVDIDHWPPIIGKGIRVRLKGIDTPEGTDPRPCITLTAAAGTTFVAEMVVSAHQYGIPIELRSLERDAYFRLDADVFINGYSLADGLVQRGYAVRWDGRGKRPVWQCPESGTHEE